MMRADQAAGYHSRMVIWYTSYYNRLWEVSAFWRSFAPLGRMLILPRYILFLKSLIVDDIFQYHFSQRQLSDTLLAGAEFYLLKLAGKIVICHPYGGDAFVQGMKVYGGKDLLEILSIDYPNIYRRETSVKRHLAAAAKHATWIIGVPPHADIMPRCDELRHCIALDLKEWSIEPPRSNSNVVRIAHSSNHRNIKGTDIIIGVCEELISEGFPIRLDIIEHAPREEAKRRYAESDIVIEQLIIGVIGMTAVEAMAMGKPVISFLREDVYSMEGWSECPVVNANPGNIKALIIELVESAEKRKQLGARGRLFVETMYSIEAWSVHNKQLYERLWNEKALEGESCD